MSDDSGSGSAVAGVSEARAVDVVVPSVAEAPLSAAGDGSLPELRSPPVSGVVAPTKVPIAEVPGKPDPDV